MPYLVFQQNKFQFLASCEPLNLDCKQKPVNMPFCLRILFTWLKIGSFIMFIEKQLHKSTFINHENISFILIPILKDTANVTRLIVGVTNYNIITLGYEVMNMMRWTTKMSVCLFVCLFLLWPGTLKQWQFTSSLGSSYIAL